MSLNAVKGYLANQLIGLRVPFFDKPPHIFIEPDIPGHMELAEPQIYVHGSTFRNYRDSIPRGRPNSNPGQPGIVPGSAGWKVRRHRLLITMYAARENVTPPPAINAALPLSAQAHYGKRTTQDPNQLLSVLEGFIESALMATQMPQRLQDPTLGNVSVLMDIGEQMNVTMDVTRALSDQATVRYLGQLELDTIEMFNA